MKPPSNRPPGNRGPDRPRSPGAPGRPSGGGKPYGERSGSGRPSAGAPSGRATFGKSDGKPRFERSSDGGPRKDGPRKDGPRTDRPRSDAPRTDRPRSDRPQSDQGGERRSLSLRPSQAPAAQQPAQRGPNGTLWLYGIHAVAAALANPARLLRRLMVTEEAEPEVTKHLPRGLPIAPERTDRARLDLLLGRGVVHQGVALLSDPLPQMSLQQALERPGPVVVLDQVGDPRNVGAIIRSAAAFGVACVIVQDRNAPDETGAMAKSASGAMERVPLIRAVNVARTLVALRAAGLWIVGLDGSGPKLSGPALAQRRVALVLGNEGDGMRRLTRETCDEVAGIAMPGGTTALDSLNVSAAAAVALYEITRG